MKGKVYLVGAGPGDYKLMTLKGLECIRKSDVIVYDRLANSSYLREAKPDCELIYVGKASSNHILPQEDINRIIAEKAKDGKYVTRLKGGDPYVFGRGGEEAETLVDEGIEFEVIPGITSAIGGLCYAGIPITHREHASSFHVITGHLKGDDSGELNWNALANNKGTLVFLMGISNLKKISENLMKEGKDKDTPVALISWATRYNQRVVTSTLENVYETAIKEEVKPPTLIVVGSVVGLREKLNFFENKPLFGKSIAVTRSRNQNSVLVEKIMDLGGNPVEIPTIKIEKIQNNIKLENEIKNINKYNYLILTSKNAVEIFFEKIYEMNFDLRILSNLKICAIGSATSNELKKRGIIADIVPKKFVAESLYEELMPILKSSDNILIPRAENARDYLVDKLKDICEVTEVHTYRTVIDEGKKDEILDILNSKDIDYITFTSSSTVNNLVEIIGKENIKILDKIKTLSIGPITTETINSLGIKLYKEATKSTIDSLVDLIIKN
ncbi:uroporphyrinogen-III C-methyltransferase [Clostridioides difficile]|nr:uroporphyrinogen-III C-methyltransferase [Clostridioides difficile]